jgi:phosphoenolpyruvate-protein kinase (PTS system EI component)
MIAMAAKAAHEAGITLGVAGRFASRTELLPFFYKMGVSYLVTGTYNIQKVKGVVERLNLEHDIQPDFDIELYNKIVNCYTGSELSDILNSFSC